MFLIAFRVVAVLLILVFLGALSFRLFIFMAAVVVIFLFVTKIINGIGG